MSKVKATCAGLHTLKGSASVSGCCHDCFDSLALLPRSSDCDRPPTLDLIGWHPFSGKMHQVFVWYAAQGPVCPEAIPITGRDSGLKTSLRDSVTPSPSGILIKVISLTG